MDNVIQKVSEEKYENVVQFNVVNTTNQSQYVNLLNTATLTPVTTSPTISYPANTSLGTFVAPFVNPITAFNTSNGDIYIGASGSNLLYVYDSNYNFITTITLGFPFVNDCRDLVYNSVDNTMYVIPVTQPDIVIVDCASYTIYTTISTPISNWISATYCTQENSVYVTTNIGFVLLIDSFLSVSTIAVSPQPYFIVYDDLQNRVYFGDNLTNTMEYIDCATNTYVNINVSFPLLITMPTILDANTLEFSVAVTLYLACE